jgi:phosphorylated CTD-interacting factor 1
LQGSQARLLFWHLRTQKDKIDPLIPNATEELDRHSVQELVATGVPEAAATVICASLGASLAQAAQACAQIRQTISSGPPDGQLCLAGTVSVLLAPLPHGIGSTAGSTPRILLVYEPEAGVCARFLDPVRDSDRVDEGIPLYGRFQTPLYHCASKPWAQAALSAAGIAVGRYTSVLELSKLHFAKLLLLYRLTAANSKLPSDLDPKDPIATEFSLASQDITKPKLLATTRKSINPNIANLLQRLYCVVARYETFAGNTGGLQGALPHHVFDDLERLCGIQHECFASPLNCHYPAYCSAFPDTDGCFGSSGSFFEFEPTDGAFEVNPPFVTEIMTETVLRVKSLLGKAAERGAPLLYFIVVPTWSDAFFYKQLQGCPHKKWENEFPRSTHEYIDGMQHRVHRTTWEANVATTAFLLCTREAERLYRITPLTFTVIKEAFLRATADVDGSEARVFKFAC